MYIDVYCMITLHPDWEIIQNFFIPKIIPYFYEIQFILCPKPQNPELNLHIIFLYL